MRVIVSLLTGAAALGLVPALGAQQKTPAPRKAPATAIAPMPEREGCVTTDGRTECSFFRRAGMDSILMKRPAIGVQLSATGTARDTLGVFVSRVTPKGPAENAGVIEGDRIVSINGVDLRVNAADAGDAYAAELPSRRLMREVGKLTPGSVANLRVYSGGRVRDVRVTVGRASDLREQGPFGLAPYGMPGLMLRSMPDMEGMRMQLRAMPDMQRMRMQLRNAPNMERIRPLLRGMRDSAGFEWTVGPDNEIIIERTGKPGTKDGKTLQQEKSSKKK